MRKIFKRFASLLTIFILTIMSIVPVHASENTSVVNVTDDLAIQMAERFAKGIGENSNIVANNPRKFYDTTGQAIGYIVNGNFGVTIKVYGYGSDTTTFDGRSISWIHQEPFIISGTGADGFYYTYDCGPITQAGSYRFNTTFRSTNFPNTTRSFSTVFTFSAN